MVEVDAYGRVQFVGGDWFSITGSTKPGATPIKVLQSRSAQAEQISEAIATAISTRTPAVFDFVDGSDGERRYLKVLPIPSPVVGGQMNALIGVSDSTDLNFRPAPASAARHAIVETPGS